MANGQLFSSPHGVRLCSLVWDYMLTLFLQILQKRDQHSQLSPKEIESPQQTRIFKSSYHQTRIQPQFFHPTVGLVRAIHVIKHFQEPSSSILLENVTNFSVHNCHCTYFIMYISCNKKNIIFKHGFHAPFKCSSRSSMHFMILRFFNSRKYLSCVKRVISFCIRPYFSSYNM